MCVCVFAQPQYWLQREVCQSLPATSKMEGDNGDSNLESEVMMLLQNRRYDPNILPRLEEFVNYQVEKRFCDSGANLAVLKLYQFYPTQYNPTIVAKILIKALMSLPSTDFLCALYLIPERKQVDEPIPVIMRLQELLETGKFQTFWEESGSCIQLLESVPGAIDAIREFMVAVIARSYKSIDKKVLVLLLKLDDNGLRKVMDKEGWKEVNGVVVLPENAENQPKPPVHEEQLTFRQVAEQLL